MKRILTILLTALSLTTFAQIQPAPPSGSKAYGTTTFIAPDGMLWYGTNPLKYRGVYPKTKVDSLLALIPVIDTSLYYTKVASDARFYPLSTNPAGYLTSFTEVDPTVPAYAKSLTAFSVIKTSTDALYPTQTGGNASGTWNINVLGNASTVTNGVYSTGSYANPSWITSLAYSKITGAPDFSGWSLTGNSGTVDGTNFIGTTDNVPLNFKVNNQKAGRIDASLGNTFFGYQSGNVITTGDFNTAFGENSLSGNTQGASNTAIGSSTLSSNTTGNNNIAIGSGALFFSETTDNNVAIGGAALNNNQGSNNTALGTDALLVNTTGSNNVAIGYKADVSTGNLTNATAIGTNAIVNASNKVQIGDTSVTTLGVGTTTFTGLGGTAKSFALPAIGGTIAISVNGNTPDANGNVTVAVGGSGTVTSVTSSDANISVANTTTTPVLTLASTISSNTTGNAATATALVVPDNLQSVTDRGSVTTNSITAPTYNLASGGWGSSVVGGRYSIYDVSEIWLDIDADGLVRMQGNLDVGDIEATGIVVSGNATASTAPTLGEHLTNKTYVDGLASNYVNTTGNQTGILGNKTWSGTNTFSVRTFHESGWTTNNASNTINNGSIYYPTGTGGVSLGTEGGGTIITSVSLPKDKNGTLALTSQFASGSANVSIAGFTTNITSSTAREETWIRVTDPTTNTSVVTVNGTMLVTPTATGLIEIAINPPVSTLFTNDDNMHGTVSSLNLSNGQLSASTLNDNIRINGTATTSGSSISLNYSYSYKIR